MPGGWSGITGTHVSDWYTPEHASWLDMAEIELSALARQCLHRRIEDLSSLELEVKAWAVWRNGLAVRVDWQFRTADARVKLRRLYPVLKLEN